MRGVGGMISFFAIANLVAAIAVLGWLVSTHRLSPERIHGLRTLFAEPVYIERARREAEQRASAEEAVVERERGMQGTMPVSAEQRIAAALGEDELARQRSDRMQRETRDLLETLRRERAALDEQVERHAKEREAFEAMRSSIVEMESGEQFRQTMKLIEGLKSPEAASVLGALIESGKKEQVVSYLNAMSPRAASRVVAEFERQDPALAADLLERLRVFGLEPSNE